MLGFKVSFRGRQRARIGGDWLHLSSHQIGNKVKVSFNNVHLEWKKGKKLELLKPRILGANVLSLTRLVINYRSCWIKNLWRMKPSNGNEESLKGECSGVSHMLILHQEKVIKSYMLRSRVVFCSYLVIFIQSMSESYFSSWILLFSLATILC